MTINDEELFLIVGGAKSGITSTFLNSIARLITVVLDLGRSIGSSIHRISKKNYCS